MVPPVHLTLNSWAIDRHRPQRRLCRARPHDGVRIRPYIGCLTARLTCFIDGHRVHTRRSRSTCPTTGGLVVSGYVPGLTSACRHGNPLIAGRLQARRNCDFSTNPGPNSCLDGGCNGGLVCDPHTGTVRHFILPKDMRLSSNVYRVFPLRPLLSSPSALTEPPTTMMVCEFPCFLRSLLVDTHVSIVSLVDGYNLPLRISNNKGCHVADCPVDLGPNCESQIGSWYPFLRPER